MRAAAIYRGMQPAEDKHPQSLGVAIAPVSDKPFPEPTPEPALHFHDGGRAEYQAQPAAMLVERQPVTEAFGAAHDRLSVVGKVLTIAGIIMLLLVATPSLVIGVERISTWLLRTTHSQP